MSDPQVAVEEETSTEEIAPELLHGAPVVERLGQRVVHPTRGQYVDVVTALHGDGYWVCIDLCGVDYLTYDAPRNLPAGIEPERFEVVLQLLSHHTGARIRVRVQVPEDDPTLPSLFAVHPGTDAMERECWDMFGITFEGHPELARILMPDEWVGHPLRKDFAVGAIPVQFKAARTAR